MSFDPPPVPGQPPSENAGDPPPLTTTSIRSADGTSQSTFGTSTRPNVDQKPRDREPIDVVVTGPGGRIVTVPAGSPGLALATVARGQRGLVSSSQLCAIGWSRAMIRGAVRNGRLHRRRRGVYAVGHIGPTPLAAETEALLALGPAVALSGISVLVVHRLVARDAERGIDLASLGSHPARSRPGIRVHAGLRAHPDRIRFVDGLPTTSVERALLDAAGELTDRELERATDEALARRLTSRTKIRELIELVGIRGRPGAARLAMLADPEHRSTATDSPAAELALRLIREAGLPEPETEVMLFGYPADFYFREAGVVFEVDSFAFHGTIKQNFERDRTRDRIHRRNGLIVVRATAEQLRNAPLAVIADLAMTIATELARRTAA